MDRVEARLGRVEIRFAEVEGNVAVPLERTAPLALVTAKASK